jgi:hypothetical protein
MPGPKLFSDGRASRLPVSNTPKMGGVFSISTMYNPTNHFLKMNATTIKDGTQLYFNDWSSGQPIVFCHG